MFDVYLKEEIGESEYKKIINIDDYLESNLELFEKIVTKNIGLKFFGSIKDIEKEGRILFSELTDDEKRILVEMESLMIELDEHKKVLIITNLNTKIENFSIDYHSIAIGTKSLFKLYMSMKKTKNNTKFTEDEAETLMYTMLGDALRENVADVYIKPNAKGYAINFEVDGKAELYKHIELELGKILIAVIGIKSKIKVETDEPILDGKMKLTINHAKKEFRINAQRSTHNGLRDLTIRVGGFFNPTTKIESLGFNDEIIEIIRENYTKNKLFLLTAPTGQGKTTALLTLLLELVNKHSKVVKTIEDPVEYDLSDYLTQLQINEDGKGKYFVDYDIGIKSLMRGKPHAILIGEIRDIKSAKGAIAAARTGHTVFSTLHTGKASLAFGRLKGFDILESEILENLGTVVSIKLKKKLCDECKVFDEKTKTYKKNTDTETFCLHCGNKGYQGKILLADSFVLKDNLEEIKINNDEFMYSRRYTYIDSMLDHLEKGRMSLEDFEEYKEEIL